MEQEYNDILKRIENDIKNNSYESSKALNDNINVIRSHIKDKDYDNILKSNILELENFYLDQIHEKTKNTLGVYGITKDISNFLIYFFIFLLLVVILFIFISSTVEIKQENDYINRLSDNGISLGTMSLKDFINQTEFTNNNSNMQ